MINVICFFVGLVLIVSGDKIDILADVTYFSIICNIIGGILMAYSTFVFENRKNKEIECRNNILNQIKQLSEKVLGNKEYKQSMELINALYDNQKQSKNFTEEVYKELKNFTCYYKDISFSNKELQSNIDKIIINLQDLKETAIESNNNIIEKQNNELKTLETIISSQGKNELKSIKNLQHQIEDLQKENHTDSVLCKESLEKIEIFVQQSGGELEKFKNVLDIIDTILYIPQEVSKEIEKLVNITNNYTADLTTKIEQLSEDLEDQDKKRMKNFERMLDELIDYNETNNDEITKQIQTLSQQYLQFEKTIERIVKQMTSMAKDDIKVMKGFLNE